MKLDVFIIDAFSDRPLAGNPAGVCPLPEWLPDASMQAIASELNQTETVFFAPEDDDYRIRWFTPTREVDHIGHATLAAGHLVLSKLDPARSEVRFRTGDDYMLVRRDGDGVALDMAALPPRPARVTDEVVAALGARPVEALAAKHHLFVFETWQEVAGLRPDMAAVARLELPAVIVTAPCGVDGDGNPVDFVSRFFAPANGVPEDPVSGVSHCCLTPYWAWRLGKAHLVGQQLSARGGTIRCEDRGERVVLGGRAAISLQGVLSLPA
ncbi:PhzF family phenazine biosynthesis protein [Kaistia terrae]|uniref:PhzF family phenazine biosynthesis protein n=1 Tax=Kaistia terrae TaxID=537017 RepID=A0ABW0PUI8_9HYPH|nr:PhzF family phenazine biosynthesis protein [Kaistia terrae]MCX5578421.1 PhzF family phenazine biosynthesis protein [Kaistia terrae]